MAKETLAEKQIISSVDGISGDFKSEKELSDYLESIINRFAISVLGEEIITYKREHYIRADLIDGMRNQARVDFFIKTKNHKAFIEVKNKRDRRYHTWAIGQLLCYGAESDIDVTDLILVTPEVYQLNVDTILKYELPIKLVLLTKEWLGQWDTALFKRLERQKKNV